MFVPLDYNIRGLRQGFGQLKDVRFEKNEPGKPSLIVHSPDFEKSDEEVAKLTDDALKALEAKEKRKRFALVHLPKSMYFIGGDFPLPSAHPFIHRDNE